MISIEEIFASAGVSAGAYTVYKVAYRLYNKYYINSECNHPTPSTTDIIVHISDTDEKQPPVKVEMIREIREIKPDLSK